MTEWITRHSEGVRSEQMLIAQRTHREVAEARRDVDVSIRYDKAAAMAVELSTPIAVLTSTTSAKLTSWPKARSTV